MKKLNRMGVDSDEIEELFDEIDADGSGEVTIGVYLTRGIGKQAGRTREALALGCIEAYFGSTHV